MNATLCATKMTHDVVLSFVVAGALAMLAALTAALAYWRLRTSFMPIYTSTVHADAALEDLRKQLAEDDNGDDADETEEADPYA